MSRLAGVAPAAGVETLLYAPAANTQGAIKVMCANRTGDTVVVTVVHRAAGGPTGAPDYLCDGEAIPPHDSRVSAVFDVANPQEVTVETDTAGVTFQANGIERDL